MPTQKQIDDTVAEIIYRLSPPDGVWFESSLKEDIEEILWKFIDRVNS